MNTKISILVFSSLFICAAHAAQDSIHDLSQDPDLLPDQAVQLDQPHLEHQPGFFTLIKDRVMAAWSNAEPEARAKVKKGADFCVKAVAGCGFVGLGFDMTRKLQALINGGEASKIGISLGVGFLGHALWSAITDAQKKEDEARKNELRAQAKKRKRAQKELARLERDQRILVQRQVDSDVGYFDGRAFKVKPQVKPKEFTSADPRLLEDLFAEAPKKSSYVPEWLRPHCNAGNVRLLTVAGLTGYAALKAVSKGASWLSAHPKTAVLGLGAAVIANTYVERALRSKAHEDSER